MIKYVLLFLITLLFLSCSCVVKEQPKVQKVGPDVPANMVIYFKRGTAEEEIKQFEAKVLSVPRPDGSGTDMRKGIRIIYRLISSQANNYSAFAVTFHDDITKEQRIDLKKRIDSVDIVFRVFENIAPEDIRESDLK